MAKFSIAYSRYLRPHQLGYMRHNSLGAAFEIAYTKYIQPNEGGYANLKNDKGGETYAGIARNFNPNWPGWTFIDFEKKKLGAEPKNNTKWPAIQYLVDQFYRDRWNANRMDEINSQEVADLLYDFHVHSQASAIRTIQKVVGVTADGSMGDQTIVAINKMNGAKLHADLLAARKAFLESLIAKNPSQEVFREGWMARLKKFPTTVKETIQQATDNINWPIMLGLTATGAIVAVVLLNRSRKKNEEVKALAA